MLARRLPRARRAQLGMSLVELMVGIAVGMFVVAAAATLVASQLSDNRRLMVELQVQQDLRSTADIITRDLRRAGSNYFTSSVSQINSGVENDVLIEAAMNQVSTSASHVEFSNTRRGSSTSGPYGYQLRTTAAGTGVIQTSMPPSDGWVDLTDADAVDITRFRITPTDETNEPPVRLACPNLCSDGSKTCWPRVTVRTFVIDIQGRSRSDPSVLREVRSLARVRNDFVEFAPVVAPAPSLSCP